MRGSMLLWTTLWAMTAGCGSSNDTPAPAGAAPVGQAETPHPGGGPASSDPPATVRPGETPDPPAPRPPRETPADDDAHAQALQQLGQALLAYHDVYGHLPPAARHEDDQPLLSWRVLLLPYLGEEELFRAFRLDEPWDSPHNRPLAERVPEVFRTSAAAGQTNFLAVAGEGTAFPGAQPAKLGQVRDGLSQTVLVVCLEGRPGVPWTAPQDLALESLAGESDLQGLVLTADGQVRRFRGSGAELIGLLTLAGGEPIDPALFP